MAKLKALNTTTFYCGGCGISPAPLPGESCRTCIRRTEAEHRTTDGIVAGPLMITLIIGAIILGLGLAAAAFLGD